MLHYVVMSLDTACLYLFTCRFHTVAVTFCCSCPCLSHHIVSRVYQHEDLEWEEHEVQMVLNDKDERFGFSVIGGYDEGIIPRVNEITLSKYPSLSQHERYCGWKCPLPLTNLVVYFVIFFVFCEDKPTGVYINE